MPVGEGERVIAKPAKAGHERVFHET
jgi:hypothetical protein